MADALYLPDGDRYLPTELTRGPWSPNAQHGGPVSALLARTAERVEAPGPMHPARLTVELLRPVPLTPLSTTARIARPGRKVQLVEVSLHADGTEVARASLLRIRSETLALPAEHGGGDTTGPAVGPHDARAQQPKWREQEQVGFHNTATEHRAVRGDWGALGPMTDWIRLRFPVVAGETPSPLQRVAAASDFGNGISGALPFPDFRFINPDLTVYLHRLPAGEWVCLDAATYPDASGVGLAESTLYDERGRIGRALQSLLLERA